MERIWVAYLGTVAAVAVLVPGGGEPEHRPIVFTALSLGLLLLHLALGRFAAAWPEERARLVRVLAAMFTMPLCFSGLGWLLPAVHPEPWEWLWLAGDRALFGKDVTVALQAVLGPAFTELLQWIYAGFYFLPLAAALVVGRTRGAAAFDRCMVLVVFCFQVSYLGYLLFPTLPPYRFLDHGPPLSGLWLAAEIHQLLQDAEANRWDCFPSGHTMLSLVALALVGRWARRWLWLFAPVVLLLVFSTMALRYHWFCDVAAGALLVWPAMRLGDLLLDRDGAAPA